MTQTKHPDYAAMAQKEIADLEPKRGLVAAELEACEAELRTLRGEGPAHDADQTRRGALAFDAILGDEDAADELATLEAREAYLERRAALCALALAHADAEIDGQRRTWLQGAYAASLPLEEIPEVVRERVRRARGEAG